MSASAVAVRPSIYDLLDQHAHGGDGVKPLEDVIRAWQGIQALLPTDPNSFFVVGGFHGEPFRGAGITDGVTWWGGYCEHATVLFPTWHRAYLLRLEQALQSIPGCEHVMQPYWDECSDRARSEGLPWVFTDPEFTFADGTRIANPLRSYTLPVDIVDQVTNEVAQAALASVYTKPAGYTTVRYPLSGMVGNAIDEETTKAHNAKFTDDAENTKLLNTNLVEWLNDVPFPPSTGDDADKFVQSLAAPTYTLFSNKTSQDAWNTDNPNGPTLVALENPHNNMHVALGGVELPTYKRDLIPGANGDMGENDTAALDPVFYFHHAFVDYVFWTWQRCHGATEWFDIDTADPGAIAAPPNSQTPAGRGQNEQLDMDSALNPFRIGEGSDARAITSRDVIDIEQLGYTYAPGSLEQYVGREILPIEPGPVLHVSRINRGRIAGSFVIAAHAEVDGAKELIGCEAVLSRWHVAGCMNCQLHLEAKAAFPLPEHVHELARSAPEKITVSVHTRRGLHGGAPLPVGAHAGGASTAFRVELHH